MVYQLGNPHLKEYIFELTTDALFARIKRERLPKWVAARGHTRTAVNILFNTTLIA